MPFMDGHNLTRESIPHDGRLDSHDCFWQPGASAGHDLRHHSLGMKLRHGGLSAQSREAREKEARMIQDIYQGLSRMEQRVEALETILMEHKERSSQDYGEKTH